MDKNKDVRILTLQKQHYFEKYRYEMKCEYSCWGYYDGISIAEAPPEKNKLFKKRSNAPISQLWYGSGESIEKLDGIHSRQNIGIFRNLSDDIDRKETEKFWKSYKTSPYFAVGFVRLKNAMLFQSIGEYIEMDKTDGENPDGYIRIRTYYTFDNADLIVLVLSNRLEKIENILRVIDDMEQIRYMYTVVGVNEAYLGSCTDFFREEWNGVPCYINDSIARITLRIATSGKKETLQKLGCQIRRRIRECKKDGEPAPKIQAFPAYGHQVAVFDIENLQIRDLLSLYVPGEKGILTHKNPLFGTEIYNIETEFHISALSVEECDAVKTEESPDNKQKKEVDKGAAEDEKNKEKKEKFWCEVLIDKYNSQMNEAYAKADESLYSYYKAMIQTLNTLMQYEGFPMAKDMFYLLFPAFDMFERHLDYALQEADNPESVYMLATIKNSVCDFINAVTSIIYHTIHTDQTFLMIPGYSGAPFSIPIKLCLTYLWLANKVIGFLNDRSYEYKCFIAPEMESCPVTTLIDMGIPRHDRLICFCSSQRSLYMPRHFMLILTHEVAHYVGTDIRKREERAIGIGITLGYFLAEGVFPEEYLSDFEQDSKEYELLSVIYKKNKKKAQEKAVKYLHNIIKNKCGDGQYHATQIQRPLEEGCLEFLSNEDAGIYPEIYMISEDVMDLLSGKSHGEKQDILYEQYQMLYQIQAKLDPNRISLQTSGVMESIIEELILVYREVFSDIAAISILDCDEDTFREAYDVSEGNNYERSLQQEVRDYIVHTIFWETECKPIDHRESAKEKSDPKNADKRSKDKKDEKVEEAKKLYTNLYSYIWVKEELLNYANSIKEAIDDRLRQIDKSGVDKVKSLYKMFSPTEDETERKSCREIYKKMIYCIDEYIQDTETRYQERKEEIQSS